MTSSPIMESVRSQGSNRAEFDVFLSFRGPDARHGIVDHLYVCMTRAGLRVFKDDEEIRRGEVIGVELKQAIDGSMVYVVVFSRNYASSVWCLRELDMIVDLCGGSNTGGKIILPIFYGADPADVKLGTNLFQEALENHKHRHGHDVVEKWKEALKTVGHISGWDSKAFQGEGEFVQSIVQDIIVKLRIKDQSLPEYLTGMNDRVLDILNLLDCDSSGVRLVVLHGMGGIGKTTLASVIFNEVHSRFKVSSFISDVRETFSAQGGIEKLQSKLSEDILGDQIVRTYNYDGEIIRRIQCKRVLLVLDDVNEFTQLKKLVGNNPEDTLRTGSRVIITTRDRNVCNGFVRPGSKLLHFYEMEKMDDHCALQLFSKHAFGTDEPPQEYLSLSKDVVETTGNLPLALVVIGRHLCCQSIQFWKSEFEKLKTIPHKEVFDILKVSYDGLDWSEKEIFLDIACFQKDEMPRRYACYLWNSRKLYPECRINVLINKSLVKVDSDDEFWIHDQLRDMGREIIRSEVLGRPEMCTRLWDPDDALKIVLQKMVSEKIIAMNLDLESTMEEHEFSLENFRGLFNLMYLRLKGTYQLTGDLGSIQETLMWHSWQNCNQRLNSVIFRMSNLVVLHLQGGLRGVEKLDMPNLKVLAVWANSHMTVTPDVSCCLKLDIMIFEICHKLIEIHHSVDKLKSLTYMKISSCRSLRSLPEELYCARTLEELIVTSCTIQEVRESIGRLKSLRTLDLRDNKIRRLPASINGLKNLQVLNVSENPLDKGIPKEIGRLSTLEDLVLSGSGIRFLPATISQLTSLKSLTLDSCEMLQEIHGLPTSLAYFGFSWNMAGLSEKIRCTKEYRTRTITFSGDFKLGLLSRLKTLNWSFPDIAPLQTCVEISNFTGMYIELGGLDSLPNLTDLSINQSDCLHGVYNKGRLRGLRSLEFRDCMMLEVIPGLEQLELLEKLTIHWCSSIWEIRDLLRLRRLKEVRIIGCYKWHNVPYLIDECYLSIRCCERLEDFEGSYREYGRRRCICSMCVSVNPFNEGIPDEIGNLSALEILDLWSSKIRFLRQQFEDSRASSPSD